MLPYVFIESMMANKESCDNKFDISCKVHVEPSCVRELQLSDVFSQPTTLLTLVLYPTDKWRPTVGIQTTMENTTCSDIMSLWLVLCCYYCKINSICPRSSWRYISCQRLTDSCLWILQTVLLTDKQLTRDILILITSRLHV